MLIFSQVDVSFYMCNQITFLTSQTFFQVFINRQNLFQVLIPRLILLKQWKADILDTIINRLNLKLQPLHREETQLKN